jgi:DNA invertase Pin-like site-specific DNA recombinase
MMREDVRRGDILIVAKFDRLFRSIQDTHNQFAEFQANGIELIILQLGPEPISENTTGKALVSLFALVAELESDFIRQRSMDGKAAKAARGGFTGGQVPIGWDKIGKGRDARLIVNERQQEMLKLARDLRAGGKTFTDITKELNRRGFRRRRDGEPLIYRQVYNWLKRKPGETRADGSAQRIRNGLARRKENGLPLGNPRVSEIAPLGLAQIKAQAASHRAKILPIIEQICAADPLGVTLQSIADELNRREIMTARRGNWYPGTVRDLLMRSGKSLVQPRYRLDGSGPLQDRILTSDKDTTGLSPNAVINDEQLNELIEAIPKLLLLKKRGRSYRDLEREFGFVRPRMVRQIDKQRKRWREMAPKRKREVIVQLARIGWSRQEISEELHVPLRTVYRHFPPASEATPDIPGPVVPGPLLMMIRLGIHRKAYFQLLTER